MNFKTTVYHNSYHTIVKKLAKCPEQHVKFVLKPTESYPDSFDISLVERNVERMLEADTAVAELDISQYDKKKLKTLEIQ